MSAKKRAVSKTRKRRKRREPVAIGWREWVALPDLGVEAIKAKIDSGARSSALHAFDLEEFERGGEPWVRFSLHPLQRDSSVTLRNQCPLVDRRWVRSSSGGSTLRPVIRSRVRLAGRVFWNEITLVRRDLMGFRMLLGRQAVRRRFLIDCGKSFTAMTGPTTGKTRRKTRKTR